MFCSDAKLAGVKTVPGKLRTRRQRLPKKMKYVGYFKMNEPKRKTPLERVVGFPIAEELYDLLELTEQTLLDLKIMEVPEHDIAKVLGVSQTTVNTMSHRIRIKLADSKLRLILEARQHYRESNPIVGERHE